MELLPPFNENLPVMKDMNIISITAGPPGETITSPGETGLLEPTDIDHTGSDFRVILYNDDFHSEDEVIEQLKKATGCSTSRAEEITVEAHFKGRAICFRGERGECQRVCQILREIRLQCEVDAD